MPTRYRKYRHRKNKTNRKYKPNKVRSNTDLIAYGKIYATWCGHCQAMESDWKTVESKLLPLKAYNIESAQKDALVSDFNTKYNTNLELKGGFPTIFKLTKSSGLSYYDGERNSHSMLNWLQDKIPVIKHEPKPKGILRNWFASN
jgi:thiol-disulfide isomerase/thioredoxin